MMVKICGITNQADAEMCVEAGASALGFNFYLKSPRYIRPADAAAIADRIPAGVVKVGIFVGESGEAVEHITREARLDVAQVHGRTAPQHVRVWRACRINEFSKDLLDGAEAVLVDTPSGSLMGGTGKTFDWTLARGLAPRVIVAGGLDDTNVRAAIEAAGPWGVDACSRLESSPGRKDAEKVRKFIQAALNV
jgi:phosphoribosylanthranilate isomerase